MSFFSFFVPAVCGWVGFKKSYKCKHDLTQNAFLSPSSVSAQHDVVELKKSAISFNYNNSY